MVQECQAGLPLGEVRLGFDDGLGSSSGVPVGSVLSWSAIPGEPIVAIHVENSVSSPALVSGSLTHCRFSASQR